MRRWLATIVLLALVSAGSWFLATKVQSPDQVAAQAQAPSPAPVTAQLSRGYLHGPVSLSVQAAPERVLTVTAPTEVTGVVTGAERAAGEAVSSGSVLLRINGRPVFLLAGAFALYRDVQPGDSGDDVTAIQAALQAAGYATGRDRTGVYGAGTQAAVRRMYKAAGFTAPESSVAAATSAPSDGSTPAPTATPAPGVAVLRAEVWTVAPVGTQLAADTVVATLGTGATVLTATVPATSVGALAVGATATFTDDGGAAGTATVATIGPASDATQSTVVLGATGAVTAGSTYVVSVENPAAESAPSLLAPVAAVVTRGGRSFVYVDDGAAFREVEVTVTGSLGGVAGIVPVNGDDTLADTAEVRIG